MAVVGDLNLVQTLNPLNALLTGDVTNEIAFGPDSPPDWDGSNLTDAHPVHNGAGTTDWTYRSGSFSPSRLDYFLYTDSVAQTANEFVLNTVSMTPAQLAATGLQQNDVLLTSGNNYDHIPVVVDFRFDAAPMPGDFNDDGTVDSADYISWRTGLGTVYSQNDYNTWLMAFGQSAGSGAASNISAVPEPACYLLVFVVCGLLHVTRRRQPRSECRD
jgi:hypothetical protein